MRNDLILRALARQPVPRTPVWMMRQAGRYLPEYRRVRERAGSFMTLCRTPELACEVTLQPLARYPLDAAILFSDILTIPDAMGLGLHFVEGEGPQFERPLRTAADITTLPVPDVARELGYVLDAVRLIRRELDGRVPLLGFSGSPWTLASYMVEGRGSRDFHRIKALLYGAPALLHELLARLTQTVVAYLQAQIEAGAQAVQVFDTWGGALTAPAFDAFSLRYLQQIVQALKTSHPDVPVIIFTKGGGQWLEALAATGADGLGIDWTTELGAARARVGHQVVLQGNLDPAVLVAGAPAVRAEVQRVLASFGAGEGHIFNLGHGITPDVDPEVAGAMIEAVHAYSPGWHSPESDQASRALNGRE